MKSLALARNRALVAGIVLGAAFTGLLATWFLTGWRELQSQQQHIRGAPLAAAELQGGNLARDLRGQLARLIMRESERLPFHYQNLFHDPRSSAPESVAPSPLAAGPDDPLVLGYFQIDDKGHVTTPTINDELPDLSEQEHLAENRAFRAEVARSLVASLAPVRREPVRVAQGKVLSFDNNTWQQNSKSNFNWQQQTVSNFEGKAAGSGTGSAESGAPVVISLSPLEWRTGNFEGAPALVAVRRVATPDGELTQGFVVDRATLTSWLATRAGEMNGRIDPFRISGENEIATGWYLTMFPNPRTVAAAAAEASALERSFLIRFGAVTVGAALAAVLVVLLVVRAERLARERSQFAAAAAHELRTPLAGLQLYGDMLADGLGDPTKMRDYAKRMSEEASRLGRVVSNVLGFSQLERGNLTVDAHVGPLGEALRELAERVQPTLDRAGAVLDLDVAPDLRARFDRDALVRIVGNLLDNAEKYARDAEDRTIRLAAKDLGDVVEVVVSDHGPGIADAARLFQPFRRGVSADGPAGLGLGLALSRSLARAMGGELVFRAGTGGGAAFALRLPRA